VPERTVTTRAAGSKDTTPWNSRRSICRPSGVAVWPPMLLRPPPIEIGPGDSRTTCAISSTVDGAATLAIRTG
jgi:hypothetical protein